MKTFYFVALSLTSSVWASCPDSLTGEYIRCSSTSRADTFAIDFVSVVIRNYEYAGATNPNYAVSVIGKDETYIQGNADGKLVSSKETDSEIGTYDVKTSAQCTAESLKIKTSVSIMDMDMTEEMVLSLKNTTTLEVKNYLEGELVNTTTCYKF